MRLLNAQLVRTEVAKHHPAARRAKINSGHPSAGHCVPFDRLRAYIRAEPFDRLRAHIRAKPFDKLRTAPVEARSLT